jgi:hypothetical protein
MGNWSASDELDGLAWRSSAAANEDLAAANEISRTIRVKALEKRTVWWRVTIFAPSRVSPKREAWAGRRSCLGARVRAVDLTELLEDPLTFFGRDTRSDIADAYRKVTVGRDSHLPVVRERDGVAHEVEQDLGSDAARHPIDPVKNR